MDHRVKAVMDFIRPLDPKTRASVNWPGLFWKDEQNVLHVSLTGLTAGNGCTCICAIAGRVESFEAFAKELAQLFEAKEVVIHDEYRPVSQIKLIELPSGHEGMIDSLVDDRPWDGCGNHPAIKGVVSWIHENQGPDFKK